MANPPAENQLPALKLLVSQLDELSQVEGGYQLGALPHFDRVWVQASRLGRLIGRWLPVHPPPLECRAPPFPPAARSCSPARLATTEPTLQPRTLRRAPSSARCPT